MPGIEMESYCQYREKGPTNVKKQQKIKAGKYLK
jgi:hypothetical protein